MFDDHFCLVFEHLQPKTLLKHELYGSKNVNYTIRTISILASMFMHINMANFSDENAQRVRFQSCKDFVLPSQAERHSCRLKARKPHV